MSLLLKPGHRHWIASLKLVGLCCVIWASVWWYASISYSRTIDQWIEAGRASGYTITYDDRYLFGFPYRVAFRFTNLKWRNTDDIEFQTDNIDISALPWKWQTFLTHFFGHTEIRAPLEGTSEALVLQAEDGKARVKVSSDGAWSFAKLDLDQAGLGLSPSYLFSAAHLSVSAEKPLTPPHSHLDTGLSIHAQADAILVPDRVPTPFGQNLQHLETTIRIMDYIPDFRLKSSLEAWNQDSGIIEFDHLRLDWGSLKLVAKGTMGFDDDLQPEGAFSSTLANHEEVLEALTKAGFIASSQTQMLQSAMNLFSKESEEDDLSGIQVPITVQLGGLFLGPVTIFSFPEIEWEN